MAELSRSAGEFNILLSSEHGEHYCDVQNRPRLIILFPGTLEGVACYDAPGDCGGNIQNDDNESGHVTRDACAGAPCQGGATCESHDGTFTCYCPRGRTGKFCEREVEADTAETCGFTGQSRLKLVIPDHAPSTPKYSLSFRFKPVSGEGVVLHSGDTILALVNGHLQFSYGHDERTGGQLVVQSGAPVMLNTWTGVRIQTYHADIMMELQDGERSTGRLLGGGARIETLTSEVFIGGLGSSHHALPGYTGCLAELKIDNSHVSLAAREAGAGEAGVSVEESEGVVECGRLTTDLMVSDQAASRDTEALVFRETDPVTIMNRVTRRQVNERRSDIYFEIRTRDKDGSILSVGDEDVADFFSVSLVNGHINVKLKINSHVGEKTSRVRVSDGEWRRMRVERTGGQVLVRVDSTRDIFSFNIAKEKEKEARGWSLRSRGEYLLGQNLTGEIRELRIKDRAVRRANIL